MLIKELKGNRSSAECRSGASYARFKLVAPSGFNLSGRTVNAQRQRDEDAFVASGYRSAIPTTRPLFPTYGLLEGIRVKIVISGGQLILRRIMLVPIPRFV